MNTIHVAYDAELLNWRLGKGHPTNPIRARNAVNLLRKAGAPLDVQTITRRVSEDELSLVHDPNYIAETLAGYNDEWAGRRADLGGVARHMFAGTLQLVDQVLDGTLTYGFSPQGAKHHAMADRGSGFCVFNDFAHAATVLALAGHRVLYLDIDAHHGDGVEALTRYNPNVVTASVHDSSIFPGTGHDHEREFGVFNFALPRSSGDRELVGAVEDVLAYADHGFDPTVVLFAIGGDGYVDDPLSTLEYSYDGYRTVADLVGTYVGLHDLPIVMGGAGGYLPHTHTPRVWAEVVKGVHEAAESVRTGVYISSSL